MKSGVILVALATSFLFDSINALTLEKRVVKVDAKQNADGSCYAHTVASGETCQYLMTKFTNIKTEANLNKWNANTFNWMGCTGGHPWAGDKVCVSPGTPPQPASVAGAQCGPQAPGAAFNTKCPLNACCSQFGYCGTTSEFCDNVKSPTGAPGTTGCLSNCGYGTLGTSPAASFKNIVYWLDTTNTKLASNPSLYDDGTYDTVHYAFVPIGDTSTGFAIDTGKFGTSPFLKLKKAKKVAAFGGWDFSTSPSTYQVFRHIVGDDSTRNQFADNLVAFVKKYNLDGIDLDWEYPQEQDIPGIKADYQGNGGKYLSLIKTIRSKMPAGKTLSVSIPSTYWYLKGFPVKDIQNYIDYFVFMTYDDGVFSSTADAQLHCHVNKTETVDSLKMLQKAGVQMSKVYGGLANYGRSFVMSNTKCTAGGCPAKGPAAQGDITITPGLLADSEINAISDSTRKVKRWTDTAANCDIMVYDTNSWVSWPKAGERNSMRDFYKSIGLGGSALWLGNYFKH
ncbi:glycoside hydrolase superfamily [Scheffersomyces xylosifermentans]|uniref:glycoside hydrolase superfamily n=1 Tax=Scheffersomyces xylosifermentans TaxID=1304137 RepID=UPI00315D7BFA